MEGRNTATPRAAIAYLSANKTSTENPAQLQIFCPGNMQFCLTLGPMYTNNVKGKFGALSSGAAG